MGDENGRSDEQVRAQLKQKDDQVQQLAANYKQSIREKQELQDHVSELERQVTESSQKDLQSEASHKREIERLTAQLNEQRSKNTLLEEELGSANRTMGCLKEEVSAKNSEIIATQNVFHVDTAVVEPSMSEEQQQLVLEYQEKTRQLESEKRELETQLNQTKKSLTDAKREAHETVQLLEDRTEALSKAQEELDYASVRLEEADVNNANLRREVDEKEQEVEELRNQQTRLQQQAAAVPLKATSTTLNVDSGSREAGSTTPRYGNIEMTEISHQRTISDDDPHNRDKAYQKLSADGQTQKKSACPCVVS